MFGCASSVNISNMNTLTTRSSFDLCKGLRSCFRSVTNTIAYSRIATSVIVVIPMIGMIFALFLEHFTQIDAYYRYIVSPPLYVISSLTFVFGILGLISIKAELQNLLGFAAFVYAGIGYWATINILILITAGWSYFPIGSIFNILLRVAIPTGMWLFASSVMDRHRILVNEAIAAVSMPKEEQMSSV
jgi:hypothetical protein